MQSRLNAAFLLLVALIFSFGFLAVESANEACCKAGAYQQAEENQRKAGPVAIENPIGTKGAKSNADREEERENEKAQLDRRVADATDNLATYTFRLFVATFVLAGFTAILVVYAVRQSGDSKRSVESSASSAVAAHRSAQAAERIITELERPYVYIENIQFKFFQQVADGISFWQPYVDYHLVNFGRSPATVFKVNRTGFVTSKPKVGKIEEGFLESIGVSLAPKDKPIQQARFFFKRNISDAEHQEVLRGHMFAFFIEEVFYRDIFGFEHICGFGVRTVFEGGQFFETAGECEAFNFQKTIGHRDDGRYG